MNSILYRSQAVDSVAMAVRRAGWCGAESGYITLLHSFSLRERRPQRGTAVVSELSPKLAADC